MKPTILFFESVDMSHSIMANPKHDAIPLSKHFLSTYSQLNTTQMTETFKGEAEVIKKLAVAAKKAVD